MTPDTGPPAAPAVSERPYEMRSGMETLEALDKASRGVEAAATELAKLSQQFGEAHIDEKGEIVMGIGLQFQSALDEEKARLYQTAVEEGKRPPPEDIREAVAQQAVRLKQPQLWVEYQGVKTRMDALRSWISNQKAVISANQSIRKGEAA